MGDLSILTTTSNDIMAMEKRERLWFCVGVASEIREICKCSEGDAASRIWSDGAAKLRRWKRGDYSPSLPNTLKALFALHELEAYSRLRNKGVL